MDKSKSKRQRKKKSATARGAARRAAAPAAEADARAAEAGACSECGKTLEVAAGRGRPRVTCSRTCRDQRQARLGAEAEGREFVPADERHKAAAERRAALLARFRELEAEGVRRPQAALARELGVRRQRAHQLVQAALEDERAAAAAAERAP